MINLNYLVIRKHASHDGILLRQYGDDGNTSQARSNIYQRRVEPLLQPSHQAETSATKYHNYQGNTEVAILEIDMNVAYKKAAIPSRAPSSMEPADLAGWK
ncbi:hypothetical protein M7I_0431 [Glarea lozoyensis 74030]|uniref:Uncharacterized protein n=1 Tax=Glarea lozoyensis (strain ATCC 74030 / MF5533) TaxID=1104152 RepID=H0EDC3_GLAL7|nr:hypothetical protein M7I_0431 [Glarea lozoyensis 74030]